MAFPTKDYNKLESLQKTWDVSQEDMFYTIENGLLRVWQYQHHQNHQRC
jgi:hypothetical protein